jgi:hypothetical protein
LTVVSGRKVGNRSSIMVANTQLEWKQPRSHNFSELFLKSAVFHSSRV